MNATESCLLTNQISVHKWLELNCLKKVQLVLCVHDVWQAKQNIDKWKVQFSYRLAYKSDLSLEATL